MRNINHLIRLANRFEAKLASEKDLDLPSQEELYSDWQEKYSSDFDEYISPLASEHDDLMAALSKNLKDLISNYTAIMGATADYDMPDALKKEFVNSLAGERDMLQNLMLPGYESIRIIFRLPNSYTK